MANSHNGSIRLEVFAILVLIVFCALPGRGQEPNIIHDPAERSAQDEFLRMAPAKWQEYAARAQGLQGHFAFRANYTPRKIQVKRDYELKRNDQCWFLATTFERSAGEKVDEPVHRLSGLNPYYGFTLARSSVTSPWILSELVPLEGDQTPSTFAGPLERFANDACILISLFNEPLCEIVRKPQFRIARCRRLVDAGEALMEVSFDYRHEVDQGANPVQRGTLVLDPNKFWCLRSFRTQIRTETTSGTMDMDILDFAQSEQGLPLPKHAVRRTSVVGRDGIRSENEFAFEYELAEPRRLPDEVTCRLSAFGLPEPMGVAPLPPRPTRWYLWFMLAAGVCAVLGLACYKTVRRLRAGGLSVQKG